MNELQVISEAGMQVQEPAEIMAEFLADKVAKPATKETYGRALRLYRTWAESQGRSLGDRATVKAYRAYLEETKSAATLSAYMTAIRSFYTWLEDEKGLPNIARGIKGAGKPGEFKKAALAPEQAKIVLQHSKDAGDSIENKRDFAIINLLIRTGLRTIEIVRANIEDIKQSGGDTLLYIQGKGRDSKDAFVVLTEATLDPIMEYLQERPTAEPTEPLFVSHGNRNKGGRMTTRSLRRIVKADLKGAGYDRENITTHSLRHTAVTLSLLGGASIQEAQAMARHRNINTTLRYAHNLDRIANAPERKIDKLLG